MAIGYKAKLVIISTMPGSLYQKLEEAYAIISEVRHLRNMQKEYFRYRDHDQLQKCKIQEKKVDGMIDAWLNRGQNKLF